MTPKERMAAVMRGARPDRTPVMCQLAQGHIFKNLDLDPLRFWYTSAGHAEGFIRIADLYGFDGILLNKTGFDPDAPSKARAVRREGDGWVIEWKDGHATWCPPDEYPVDLLARPAGRPARIADLNLDAIERIESERDLPPYYFDILDAVSAQRSATHSIHGEVCAAFSGLLYSFDSLSDGLMALVDDPAKCHAALRLLNRNVITMALAQCRRGVDALKLSSAFAGAGFLSRAMYEEFVLPYEREVFERVHAECGTPCYVHTCGHIGDRLDLMMQDGMDGIECLDPPPLGSVDLEQAVAQIGAKVFIKGNLDSVNELMGHTPEEVRAIAMRRIEIGRRAKGYILSSACSVSPRVPPENLRVLREAVEAAR